MQIKEYDMKNKFCAVGTEFIFSRPTSVPVEQKLKKVYIQSQVCDLRNIL